MEGKLRYLKHFGTLFILFLVQCSPLSDKISVAGIVPNAVFVMLFIYSLHFKFSEVMCYAVIFGSLIDLIFGHIYGVMTLLFIGFTCLFYLLNKYIYTESFLTVGCYCFTASLLYEVLLVAVNVAVWGELIPFSAVFMKITVQCFYNTVFAMPAFALARKAYRKRQEVRL